MLTKIPTETEQDERADVSTYDTWATSNPSTSITSTNEMSKCISQDGRGTVHGTIFQGKMAAIESSPTLFETII